MSIFKRSREIDDYEMNMAEIEYEMRKLEKRYENLKDRMRKILKHEKMARDLEKGVILSRLDNVKMELSAIFDSLKELFKRMRALMLMKLMKEEREFLNKFEYLKDGLNLDEVENEIEEEIRLFKLESEEVEDVLNALMVYLGGGEDVFKEKEGREEKTGDEVENIPTEKAPERGDEQIHEVEE